MSCTHTGRRERGVLWTRPGGAARDLAVDPGEQDRSDDGDDGRVDEAALWRDVQQAREESPDQGPEQADDDVQEKAL